jgi:predicted esterase
MRKADRILREVYAKAGASDRYEGRFYSGGHKFDLQMQAEAFEWLDSWLK